LATLSYGRVVLDAATTDTYTIGIEYAAGSTYPVKVFVNGEVEDFDFPNSGWAASTYDLSLYLDEGENVFIIAMLKWGVINKLSLPEGVTLVDTTVDGDTYAALGPKSRLRN
jgi:hypothetical protein